MWGAYLPLPVVAHALAVEQHEVGERVEAGQRASQGGTATRVVAREPRTTPAAACGARRWQRPGSTPGRGCGRRRRRRGRPGRGGRGDSPQRPGRRGGTAPQAAVYAGRGERLGVKLAQLGRIRRTLRSSSWQEAARRLRRSGRDWTPCSCAVGACRGRRGNTPGKRGAFLLNARNYALWRAGCGSRRARRGASVGPRLATK